MAQECRGDREIDLLGDLEIRSFAFDQDDGSAVCLDDPGVIGRFGSARVRGPKRARRECLRCLNRPQFGSIDHATPDPSDGVGDINDRNCGGSPVLDRPYDDLEQGGGRQRASCIVNDDHLGRVGNRGKPCSDRLRPSGTTGHDNIGVDGPDIGTRPHQHHAVAGRAGRFERSIDNPAPTEFGDLLRAAETRSGPPGDNDDPTVHPHILPLGSGRPNSIRGGAQCDECRTSTEVLSCRGG